MINDGKGTPGDPDRGWTLWIVSVVMVIFSGIFVIARLAIRLSRKMLGIDDYIIFVGLVGSSNTANFDMDHMLSQPKTLV